MSLFKKNIGKIGEELALKFLKQRGFRILHKNFNTKYGEIDIVVQKQDKVHFIEVKTRTSLVKGAPYEAVNFLKLKHIKKVIDFYILQNNLKNYRLSLDVISILLDENRKSKEIKHFEGVDL